MFGKKDAVEGVVGNGLLDIEFGLLAVCCVPKEKKEEPGFGTSVKGFNVLKEIGENVGGNGRLLMF